MKFAVIPLTLVTVGYYYYYDRHPPADLMRVCHYSEFNYITDYDDQCHPFIVLVDKKMVDKYRK